MKKIDLSQTITILTNLAVIAGIVFLGLELNQNNELLSADARTSRADIRRSSLQEIINSPDLARAISKARNGEGLTDQENLVLTAFFPYVLVGWQHAFTDFRAGLIEEQDIPVGLWRVWFHGNLPGLSEYWQTSGNRGYRADFVQFMEENVVNER